MKAQRDEPKPVTTGMVPRPESSGIAVWLPLAALAATLGGGAAALAVAGDPAGALGMTFLALGALMLAVASQRHRLVRAARILVAQAKSRPPAVDAVMVKLDPIRPDPLAADPTDSETAEQEAAQPEPEHPKPSPPELAQPKPTQPKPSPHKPVEQETAVRRAITAVPHRPPEVRPARGITGLVRANWQELLQGKGVAVAFDKALWQAALRRLRPDALEQGGVALTVRGEHTLLVFGMVFPTQVHANSVRCEFSSREVDRVRHGISAVADELGLPPGAVTVTWVHTHPRLGVFLSGTDVATSAKWRSLDPRFTPIVIDISQPTLADQVGVFDANGVRLRPITTVDGLVVPAAVSRIAASIDGVYRGEGSPPPLILMRSWQEQPVAPLGED